MIHWYDDIWRTAQWTLLSLSFLLIAWSWLKASLGRITPLYVAFLFSSGLFHVYFGYPEASQWSFHLSTVIAEALLWLTLSLALFSRFCTHPENLNDFRLGAIILGQIMAIYMLVKHFTTGVALGFVPSPAMASSLLACLLPFVFKMKINILKNLTVFLFITAIFYAGGTTGVLSLGVVIMAYYGPKTFLLAIPALAIGILFMPTENLHTFWNSTGRTECWRIALDQWNTSDWATHLIGFGVGTWEWLFPIHVLKELGNKNPMIGWLFAHNEWVQVLWEQGALGILALTTVAIKVVLHAKSPFQKALVSAYGIAMLTQAPFRIAPFQLLGVYILAETCRNHKQA